VAVVGATASGKTGLAIALAERLESEVISADSMQVYQGMEIGAATPTAEEQAQATHHLVSFLDPSEHYSAAQFSDDARPIVERLNGEGKTAVVAGGAGLYVRALIDGLFDGPERDDAFRKQLREEAEAIGVNALHERLKSVDPAFAATIHPNDMRRIERGLEVYEIAGRPLSDLHREHQEQTDPIETVQVAIDWPRDELYRRVEARVDQMLAGGFVEEVQQLLDTGHGPDIERLRSRGHPELAAHLRGECTLEEVATLIKRNTRHLAKRQLSWFRPDERVHWIPAGDLESLSEHVMSLIL
jgi:tRNA dimethylallyltransferase